MSVEYLLANVFGPELLVGTIKLRNHVAVTAELLNNTTFAATGARDAFWASPS